MRTIIVTAALLVLLIGGYFWHQAELSADTRSTWVNGVLSEDSQVSIGFSACGLGNRDVKISAFTFGVEDFVTEDIYSDKISHGELRGDFYKQGFRHVLISGSDVLRPIIIKPQSEKVTWKINLPHMLL